MNNDYTIKDLENLYNEAKYQYEHHVNQVSGVWSISGEEFCERYAFLNYDDAIFYEEERDHDDFLDFVDERFRLYRNLTGTWDADAIPAEIQTLIEDKAHDDYDWHNEGEYFWWDIMGQIENEIKDLKEEK